MRSVSSDALLTGRDKAVTGAFDLVQIAGKGRGLVASRSLRANEVVLVDSCAFVRVASKMCVKCGSSAHSVASCEPEAASLMKTFGATSIGLLSQFYCEKSALSVLFELVATEGSKEDERGVKRFYDGCSKRLRDRMPWADFVRLYRVCETNAHTGQDMMGVFPLVAMINHSCDHNCTYTSVGSMDMAVKTTRAIAEGEELSVCYTTVFLPLAVRQRILKARYGFACQCSRCDAAAVDLSRAFHCGCAGGGVVCPVGRGDKNSDWICLSCSREPVAAEIAKYCAAEVYPNLVNSLVKDSKEPSSLLSWEKLKGRTAVLAVRHWLMFFGQQEAIKIDPERTLLRLIFAAMKHCTRQWLFSSDMVTLLELLSKCARDGKMREEAAALAALVRLVVATIDTRDNVEDEFERLFYPRIWPAAEAAAAD